MISELLGFDIDDNGNLYVTDNEKVNVAGFALMGLAFVTGCMVTSKINTVRVNKEVYNNLVRKSNLLDNLLSSIRPIQ